MEVTAPDGTTIATTELRLTRAEAKLLLRLLDLELAFDEPSPSEEDDQIVFQVSP